MCWAARACSILAGLAAGGCGGADTSLDAIPPEAIHHAVADGTLVGMPNILFALGKVFLAAFLRGSASDEVAAARAAIGRN